MTTHDISEKILIFVISLESHIVDSQSMFVDPILSRVIGGSDFYVIKSDILDPSCNYDFTYLKDNGITFIHGKELYKQPYGWDENCTQY
ncbi:hypothetical protein C1646_770037 [Rhizophagus diaphanus]|nr:hypothetical protein C1646_770037 [Rhizophagus diaphanus] [Rhizophagus sp. MUCL 43196]